MDEWTFKGENNKALVFWKLNMKVLLVGCLLGATLDSVPIVVA